MRVPQDLGQNALLAEVGLELTSRKGLAVRLGYHHGSSGHQQVDGGQLKVVVPF